LGFLYVFPVSKFGREFEKEGKPRSRGFGGSHFPDWIFHADEPNEVFPFENPFLISYLWDDGMRLGMDLLSTSRIMFVKDTQGATT